MEHINKTVSSKRLYLSTKYDVTSQKYLVVIVTAVRTSHAIERHSLKCSYIMLEFWETVTNKFLNEVVVDCYKDKPEVTEKTNR